MNKVVKMLVIFSIYVWIQGNPLFAQNANSLMVENLRCEHRINPEGIDVSAPRLSWALSSELQGDSQTAYHILVASSPELLKKNQGDLWDSNKKLSEQTLTITYDGRPLASRTNAWWKVQVWDKDGKVSPWSGVSSWSMGLLKEGDWEALWIADSSMVQSAASRVAKDRKDNGSLPATYARKEFTVYKPIRKATAYVSAKGLYEFYLNGQRMGDQLLAPEWTSYEKRISYQTYDATMLLQQGVNVAGAILGEGWFAGDLMIWERFAYGAYPSLLAQIEIEYTDYTRQVITTDDSWKSTIQGPITGSSIYHGEQYDARLESGWSSKGFENSAWSKVKAEKRDSKRLVWLRNEPIRVEKEMYPVSVTEPTKGVYVFDLGQNMVGWCKIEAQGVAGQTIQIRYGEAINKDGSLYTENLRGARQTDSYIPGKTGTFEFEPRFTYHGFQYVEITGLAKSPTKQSVTGKVFHSSSAIVSHFECSDSSINKLMNNILWTQRANLMSSPNDCPQRDERFGWLGDIQAFAQTGIFNMDLSSFFTKFLQDIRDDQSYNGSFTDFVPFAGNQDSKIAGAPAWADAGVFLPWTAYINYADTQMLEDQFRSATRYIDYVYQNNPDFIWRNSRGSDYNDWLNADNISLKGWPIEGAEVPKEVFATAFFARSTQIVAKMAKVLHRQEEEKYYNQLAENIKTAFNNNFVQADGRIFGDTQAGYALALHFDLLSGELRSKAVEFLVENIRNIYDGHLSTGIQSTHRAMIELSEMDYSNLAWELLTDRSFPSWMYMIDNGASTIWERWDGFVKGRGFQSPGMNSLNHWALGSVGEWVWRNIAGLKPDENYPGWKHFFVAPSPGGGVTWAKSEYHSIRGKISSSWEIKDQKFHLEITIPPGTSATVYLPDSNPATIKLNNQPFKPLSFINGSAMLEIQSGTYHFVSEYKQKEMNRNLLPPVTKISIQSEDILKTDPITLQCDNKGATIFYTLDGSDPTKQSMEYKEPFTHERSALIKARAYAPGIDPGYVTKKYFSVYDPEVNGLKYEYFSGNWQVLPDFGSLIPEKTGKIYNIGIESIKSREDFFGIRFKGWIKIPADGEYTFYLISDDGSRLFIDGQMAIANDGLHGNVEKTKQLFLKMGKYPIVLEYFQGGNEKSLSLQWKGPDFKRHRIDASDFFITE